MQLAIATTTIRNPVLLREFRAMRDDSLFVIAGDLKSPHAEIEALATELDNTLYLHPQWQEQLGYACVPELPWNCIQRRNIATLEAIRQGADVVILWDDDNRPVDANYFADIERAFRARAWIYDAEPDDEKNGPWFNPGGLAEPPYYYRGFPYSLRDHVDYHDYWHRDFFDGYGAGRSDRQAEAVGVVNGLVLGDPDISATERLERKPDVHSYDVVAHEGVVVTPTNCWSMFNSQNTAYLRELTPLALLMPHIGRMDDIFGSLIAYRVLMETKYGVLYGKPFVHQDRNEHDLVRDLEQELFGIRYLERFADDLRSIALSPQASIVDNLATVVDGIGDLDYLPPQAVSFARAWVEDIGRLL